MNSGDDEIEDENISNREQQSRRESFLTNLINKPQDTKFSQQRLIAWTPMLTPKFVLILFLVASFVFITIGILLVQTSYSLYELKYDYTYCKDVKSGKTCEQEIELNSNYLCKCRLLFEQQKFNKKESVNVYYMLEKYYQNHRRYVKSRDDNQLTGHINDGQLSKDCEPFRYQKITNQLSIEYTPCGSIANSLFNDTFKIYYLKSNNKTNIVQVNISKIDIAWNSDRMFKFNRTLNIQKTLKPPNWKSSQQDINFSEDLIVWMRTAAFSTFQKLYGRILYEDNQDLWKDSDENGFLIGDFYVEIEYSKS